MERTGIRREKRSHHRSGSAHERNVERHARMRCYPTRALNDHETCVRRPCPRTRTNARGDPPRSVQEKRSDRPMFLYTTTLDSVGRGISYESSRRANVLHARASTFLAKERNQTLGRIPPPSLQRGDGASTNTRGYGTLKCARARLVRQKAPPFRRAPSSLHVQGPNKRPTPFPGLKDRGVAMTCPTSKGSDRSSSYGALHSVPFIWRPRFGDETTSHVVCPRSTCKKANVFAKEPPTSIVARHFRDRTCVRSVFDGMRIAHGFPRPVSVTFEFVEVPG